MVKVKTTARFLQDQTLPDPVQPVTVEPKFRNRRNSLYELLKSLIWMTNLKKKYAFNSIYSLYPVEFNFFLINILIYYNLMYKIIVNIKNTLVNS